MKTKDDSLSAQVLDLSRQNQSPENGVEGQTVEIQHYKDALTINIMDKIFFDSGKAEIKPEGEDVLRRVGYVDVEKIMQVYTPKFLEAEIKAVEEDISLLLFSYDNINPSYSEPELYEMQKRLQDKNVKLSNLKINRKVWDIYGEVEDDVIFEKIQKNIMEAINRNRWMKIPEHDL